MPNPETTMKPRFTTCLLALLTFAACDSNDDKDPLEVELDAVREATRKYESFAAAQADGYTVQATAHRTGMGFHYLNPNLLDQTFEASKPEILMYIEKSGGGMEFVGIEYATPIADLGNPPPAPAGFTGTTDEWVVNEEFSLWTLHAWIWLENPHGLFNGHNPNIP